MKDVIKKCLPTYEIVDKIGEGIHGSVYRVKDQLKERAVKIVPIRVERSRLYPTESELDSKVSQDFHAVREYYETIKGDGVINVHDFHLVDKQVSKREAEAHLVILMELCPVSLQDYVIDHFPLTCTDALFYMKSLARVLERLSRGIRNSFLLTDFKPSNLLLTEDNRLLIGDLGGLKRLSSVSTITNAQFTPNWSAPELVLKGERPSLFSAVYSYGLVAYYIWEGQLPYENEDFIERIRLIRDEGTHYDNPEITITIHDLIIECLRFDAEDRPGSFGEIIERIEEIEKNSRNKSLPLPLNVKKKIAEIKETQKAKDVTPTLDMGTRIGAKTSGSIQNTEKSMKMFRESNTGMEFVWVEGGTFLMGCRDDDPEGYDHEKPAHEVIVNGFWIGRYPVTQAQWKIIMGNNPSHFIKSQDHPVEQVSWEDANRYLDKLNSTSKDGRIFKLPTEKQWEYAARSGGKDERFAGGNAIDELCWYKDNSEHSTQPVGLKLPNGLGIYDMCGNVMEWCEDLFDEEAYVKIKRNKPVVPLYNMERAVRGGGYNLDARRCRTTARRRMSQRLKYINLGLRVIMTEEKSGN